MELGGSFIGAAGACKSDEYREACSLTTQLFVPRGRFFEQFKPGDTIVSAGRTITEADIVNFAGVAGDFAQIHLNAERARQSPYGRRIAHGMLGLSIATGLLVQLGFIEETILAFRELTWKFSLPIYIGDTVHAQAEVAGTKAIPQMGGGMITLSVQLINQDVQVVQSGRWGLLIASRPGG
jgi:acyl dehydratase